MFGREPALIVSVIVAVIGVLVTVFGVDINDGQKEAIVAVTYAVLALIGGAVVRSQVTPTK